MTVATTLLILVALSRLFELIVSKRHEKRLKARGGYEVGGGHYPALVALHSGWLIGLFILAHDAAIHWAWLWVFLLMQCARIWTILSLGERWTTRIIILPNAPLITRGPYRFFRHPNYMIVAVEIASLPLAFGLPLYAFLFSIANAMLLAIRIQSEDEALGRPRWTNRSQSPQ